MNIKNQKEIFETMRGAMDRNHKQTKDVLFGVYRAEMVSMSKALAHKFTLKEKEDECDR